MIFKWDDHKFCDDHRRVIILSDRGENKYNANNPGQKRVTAYRFDNGVITQNMGMGNVCDYILRLYVECNVYMIEFKGRDVETAIRQIRNSIAISRTDFHEMKITKIHGRIICNGVSGSSSDALRRAKDEFRRDYDGTVVARTHRLEETI
jgi:hypothetical protein